MLRPEPGARWVALESSALAEKRRGCRDGHTNSSTPSATNMTSPIPAGSSQIGREARPSTLLGNPPTALAGDGKLLAVVTRIAPGARTIVAGGKAGAGLVGVAA